MTLIEFLVLGLATWRVSSLLASEDGINGWLERLRHAIGVRYDERSEEYAETELARRILCIWCNSLWVGILWSALWLTIPRVAFALALPLAFSAVAAIVHSKYARVRKIEF